jgi:hypothetical protein
VLFAVLLVNDWSTVASHPREVIRQFEVGTPMTILGAMLAWKVPRPRALDLLCFAGALALWAAMLRWSTSPVFSAMIFSMLVLQAAAAWDMRWKVHPVLPPMPHPPE